MELFEHRSQPLLPRRQFIRRLANFSLIAISIIVISLLIGIVGYMGFAHLKLVDAFLNAAMIMGGMGPISELPNNASKIFAGFYALYCGMVLLIAVGIMIAPAFHRILHIVHLEAGKKPD